MKENLDSHKDIIPTYFYQDGSEVKENDIVFYSEDQGDHQYHYADSIGIIVKRENDFKMKSYVITMDDARTFLDYEEPEHNMVSLKYSCENHSDKNILQHITKLGKYPKDKKMLSAEYAMLLYSYTYNKLINTIDMEEELITYKTAKLAKEKGFYHGHLEYYYNINGELQHVSHAAKIYPAPTQALLQRWLREEHNKNIVIVTAKNNDSETLHYCYSTKGIQVHDFTWKIYDTYELALEAGLQEMLNEL